MERKDTRTPEQVKGQDGSCPTVKVKADNEQGCALINAHDFDPKVHDEFVEPSAAAAADKAKAKAK